MQVSKQIIVQTDMEFANEISALAKTFQTFKLALDSDSKENSVTTSSASKSKLEDQKQYAHNLWKHWTTEEHQKFLSGLEIYPRGKPSKIQEMIGSRSLQQVVSHIQKFREKMDKLYTTAKQQPINLSLIDIKPIHEIALTYLTTVLKQKVSKINMGTELETHFQFSGDQEVALSRNRLRETMPHSQHAVAAFVAMILECERPKIALALVAEKAHSEAGFLSLVILSYQTQ